MANTYHQVYIHLVFSVKSRSNLIPKEKKNELHKYITGVVQNKKCKIIAINSMPDHIHIFIGLHPTIAISNLVKEIKIASTDLVKRKRWSKIKFNWQDGFGVFSHSHSQIDKVYKYIMNQEDHHKKRTFKDEYKDFMKKYGVEYDEKYLFDIE
ncbi:MAG: IS200/IS605 family transposase [Melioribacteraceae bacterium]|nr:IS200/IS605 family transposase [Melioribacteraceae bacterium]